MAPREGSVWAQEALPGVGVGGRDSFWHEQRGNDRSCLNVHTRRIFSEPRASLRQMHVCTHALTRMHPTHALVPTTPMHRSLHTLHTHTPTLVQTCVGGPDPGEDPPPCLSWPSAGPESEKDSTQVLCPSRSGLPTRGFTGHLLGHNPLCGRAPELPARSPEQWGLLLTGLAFLVSCLLSLRLGKPEAQQIKGTPSPTHSAGPASLPSRAGSPQPPPWRLELLSLAWVLGLEGKPGLAWEKVGELAPPRGLLSFLGPQEKEGRDCWEREGK